MNISPDWTSLKFSQVVFGFDRSGFAFEFLRRNAEYRKDYSAFLKSRDSSAVPEMPFSQKWGLVFPG
ncbi:transcriptional regulator domain-containing protein [Agrobacterium deltaense]|uniref:transcriptional regulator domain-containing protein n=1 Tax=Agrobacterium deltaense TaxID=1183412 RepID=UPI001C6E1006|nr:DUF6499 domain-containing protein [Agrobacterium deltaense]MBW9075679.1 hypothetical protein [Agrobacterium deltaense]